MSDKRASSEIFGQLRAEYETEWLSDVFVTPDGWNALLGHRSSLVFGPRGSGRTALCKQMIHTLEETDNSPLIVEWEPSPIQNGDDRRSMYVSVREQMYDQIARALVQRVSREPVALSGASGWVQETAAWFVQRYVQGNRRRILARMEEDAPDGSLSALRLLLTGDVEPALAPHSPDRLVIAELADTVQRMGWNGIWIIIDGLERWLTLDDLLISALDSLLSTLELFETPGFVVKIAAPRSLEAALMQSGGVLRSRLAVTHLNWSSEQLQAIVEARLAYVSGKDSFTLGDLYDRKTLLHWLGHYGGGRPRGWLEHIRPVVDHYFTSGKTKPLGEDDWKRIQRLHPPRLHIDLRGDRTFLGYKEIENIPPTGYQLLRYLYQLPERECSREELYYRVYQNLSSIPVSHVDEGWVAPTKWRSWYDTTISRLRRAIEPDTQHPVYLVTVRGKGVALRNTV